MLILTRKPGEATTITNKKNGEEVEVVVLSVKGNQVRIGFGDDEKNFNVARDDAKKKPAA